MLKQLPTLILVTVVSALVWLLAESESIRTEVLRIDVRVESPDTTVRLARVAPDSGFTGVVDIRVEGSTARLDQLRDELRGSILLSPGQGGIPTKPGTHTVDLASALREHASLRDSGVALVDCEPPAIAVVVDDVVAHDVRLTVSLERGELDGEAEVTPPTVRVLLPASVAGLMPEELPIRIGADVLVLLPEGKRTPLSGIRVELPEVVRRGPFGKPVVTPETVAVSLALKSGSAAEVLETVPVLVRLEPVEFENWDITIPEQHRAFRNVNVSGPREVVGQIMDGKLTAAAFVTLTFEDLQKAAAAGTPLLKEAVFGLTEPVPAALRFEVPDRTVRVFVKRRPPTVSPAEPGGG